MRAITLSLATAALALAGCDAARHPDDQGGNNAGAADVARIESELKSIEAQWEKDYQARDVEKVAGHYADEAALANPGSSLATDTVGRRLEISKFVSDPSVKVTFSSDRVGVAASGDLAYTRGHYSDQTIDPKTKQPKTETGSYLTVWKKQADGSWKAIEDFVTPGPPPAPPPAPGP